MVPVVMVLLGVALGFLGPRRSIANGYLVVGFAVVLIVQSVLVFGPGQGSSTLAYWVVQAGSLLTGLLLLNGIRAIRAIRAARSPQPRAKDSYAA